MIHCYPIGLVPLGVKFYHSRVVGVNGEHFFDVRKVKNRRMPFNLGDEVSCSSPVFGLLVLGDSLVSKAHGKTGGL